MIPRGLKRMRPGETLTAETVNAIIDHLARLSDLNAAPPLEVIKTGSLPPTIRWKDDGAAKLYPLIVAAGPDPDTPIDPAECKYRFEGAGLSGVVITDKIPDLGRPFDVANSPGIYPADRGARAFLVRFSDAAGEPVALVWLPFGGAPGSTHRGERLYARECDGGSSGGSGGSGALSIGQLVDLVAAELEGRETQRRGDGETQSAGDSTMLIRQQAYGKAYVKLDNAVGDGARVRIPPAAIAATGTAKLARGLTTHTWATATISAKAVIAGGEPVDWTVAKSFGVGGGMITWSEAELAGLTEIDLRMTGSAEASGSMAEINIGFVVLEPPPPGTPGLAPSRREVVVAGGQPRPSGAASMAPGD